jgi:hypothetical protein
MLHTIAGNPKTVATTIATNIVRWSGRRELRRASQAVPSGKVACNATKIKAAQIYPFMILFAAWLLANAHGSIAVRRRSGLPERFLLLGFVRPFGSNFSAISYMTPHAATFAACHRVLGCQSIG